MSVRTLRPGLRGLGRPSPPPRGSANRRLAGGLACLARSSGRGLPRLAGALALFLLLPLLTASCASVPEEAVVLSNVVGTQIAEHRASHEAFVRRYYARSRDVVEMFLRDRWVPEYLDRFVTHSGVMELLVTPEEVFSEDDLERLREEIMAVSGIGEVRTPLVMDAVSRVFGDAERGRIMLDFARVAMDEIEAQRAELMEPLDEQEREVLTHLSESYGQLQQAQAQVTAYLASTGKVSRSQDEVLEVLGLRRVRDDALERAVRMSERLTAAARTGETAMEALEEMKEIIRAGGAGALEPGTGPDSGSVPIPSP